MARPGAGLGSYDLAKLKPVRLKELLAFTCDRCGQAKKSKNVVLVDAEAAEGNSPLICNGCYGALLNPPP